MKRFINPKESYIHPPKTEPRQKIWDLRPNFFLMIKAWLRKTNRAKKLFLIKNQFISIFKILIPLANPICNNSMTKIHQNNIPKKTFLSQKNKISIKIS